MTRAAFRGLLTANSVPIARAEPITHDAEANDDILLTMLAALSDDQRRRLVKLIANSPA